MNILVIQTAFIGDTVLSLCIAEELRRTLQEVRISYLVRPESAELIKLSPSVNNVLVYDKYGSERGKTGLKKKIDELNTYKFDSIICLHTSYRTALLLKKLNVSRKIGFSTATTLLPYLTDRVPPNNYIQHTERILELLIPLIGKPNYKTLPKLSVKKDSIEFEYINSPYIVIAPGSVWKTKQWGVEHFAQLTKKLINTGVKVILVGSAQEIDSALKIVNYVGDNVVNLCGMLSLTDSAYIISHAQMIVANDSAPIHIATAYGIRSLSIFGPTSPAFGFAPPETLGKVIESEGLWCRPCSMHGNNICPIYTHQCMENITVDMVYESIMKMLR